MADGSQLATKLAGVGDVVSPAQIRMLRELAKESRLSVLSAFPDADHLVARQRHRARIKNPFVEETITHLGLFDDLAALVERGLDRVRERLDPPTPALPQRPGELREAWAARAQDHVRPDDVLMLRRLAREARLLVIKARAQPETRASMRRPHWARTAFLSDAIRHLELLDELARLVEGRLWDE